MAAYLRALLLILLLLIGGAAWAQEPKAWLGADVQDVTKAEADKLGWDTPHGAKLGVVATGSPADKAGLKTGDIVVSIDRTEIDTASELSVAIEGKRPGAEIRLRVVFGGRERRVAVTLARRPGAQSAGAVPHLTLDTGGHMGSVYEVAIMQDGKTAISGGDDKAIRVWDIATGRTIRILRGDVSQGLGGRVNDLALSPDGQFLAVAVNSAESSGTTQIRLYSLVSLKPLAVLPGHGGAINSLAFSSDSSRLLSAGQDGRAVIWNRTTRSAEAIVDQKGARIFSARFMKGDTQIVTAGDVFNGEGVHVWSTNGQHLKPLPGFVKQTVVRVAVSPIDGTIAAGDWGGQVRLWSGKTDGTLGVVKLDGKVVALQFTPDGSHLVVTASKNTNVLKLDGLTVERTITHFRAESTALIPQQSSIVIVGTDVGVWSLDTGARISASLRAGSPIWSIGFSVDGKQIIWGKSDYYVDPANRGPLEFTLDLPSGRVQLGRLGTFARDRQDILRSQIARGARRLVLPAGSNESTSAELHVYEGEKRISRLSQWSVGGVYGFTYTPAGRVLAGSARGHIFEYDEAGKRTGELAGHSGMVLAIAPSPDGRLLVSGSNDQTIGLWNLETRELIVTLFHGRDGEWVMWTPQGYYTGSPGADKIVGWQINKGPEHVADYVGAEQLRQHLNRPDIVEKAIVLASAEQAVREAPGTTFQLADLLKRPVPRFRILSPASGTAQRGGRAIVRIALEDTPDPVKAIRVQVNGRQVEERTPEIGSGGFKVGEEVLDVPLAQGHNEVRITLTNTIGDKAETLSLTHEGEGALDKRGTLYILAIGVDKYPGLGKSCGDKGDASCDLTFSGADARALVAAVEKRLGPAHTSVVKRILVNGAGTSDDPTADNILDAIDLLKQAQETDTVLLFIAGHGFNDGPNYRFLATNAERIGDAFRGKTVVPWQILQEAVETAKGRRVLFIDTCHAGNAYNQRLGNAAYHANIIAYTAARFDQEAIEDPQLGHGLFTYAVVEGLDGKGGLDAKRQISTRELADYVVKRVDELAKALKGQQEPQYFKGRDAQDYVLARW